MKKILIIEDDKALRENTAEILELENFRVFQASHGKNGIIAAKKIIPDLIICDIMMPEASGYEVLEAVSLDPVTSGIPFIFLSAKSEYREIRLGMELGADDYLVKPFEEDELLKAINSRLAKSASLSRIFTRKRDELETNAQGLKNIDELKNFFIDHGEHLIFENEEMIYREGEHTNKIYYILNGVVKCYKSNSDGKELTTSLYRSGDFLGLTSFVENIAYRESALTLESVELAALSKTEMKRILEKSEHVCLELMNELNEKVLDVYEKLLHMAYSSVYSKTAQTILEFSSVLNNKPGSNLRIKRSDLASVAGIATESLIRALSSFKKDGLIDIEGPFIRILDFEGLRRLV